MIVETCAGAIDRPCGTCAHRVRHLGTMYCARPLTRDADPAHLRLTLIDATTCDDERTPGRWLSLVTGMCGTRGRYWRAK